MADSDSKTERRIEFVARIVVAYVSYSPLSPADLGKLIENVSATLSTLSPPTPELRPAQVPAVPVSKSVTRDFLISLENGSRCSSAISPGLA